MPVSPAAIEESLGKAADAVAAGKGLAGTGFWQAVAEVKRHPDLIDLYAERIADIDQRAHRAWAVLTVPLAVGTVVAVLVNLAGIALVWWAYYLESPYDVVAFLVGLGVLLGGTHAPAHLVVGRALGIRFTYWFVGGISQPQPGVKIDYRSYLRAPARSRAWMHAAGALTTKAIPFLLIGAAIAAGLPSWVPWGLAVLGSAMIVTDVLWSSRASDWKKFRREMELAQEP